MTERHTIRILASTTSLRFIVVALSLVINIFLSRALGVADRGNYQVVIVVASLMMSIGSLSIELSLSQSWSGLNDRKREHQILATTALSGCIGLGVVSGIIIGLLTSMTPWLGQRMSVNISLLLGLTTLLMLVRAVTQRVLFLTGKSVLAAVATVVESFSVLSLLIVTSLFKLINIELAVAIYIFGTIISIFLGIWVIRNYLVWPRFRYLRSLLRNGLRFHPGQLAVVLLIRLDLVLLGILSTPDQAGLYAVAIAITGPLDVIGLAITTTFLNRLFTNTNTNAVTQTQNLVRMSLSIIPIVGILAAILSPVLVPVLWGSEFTGTIMIVWILLPGACALSIQRPFGQYLVRMGLAGSMNLRAAISLSINIALNIFLIPIYGAIGAAVACSISYSAYTFMSMTYFAKHTGMPLSRVMTSVLPRFTDIKRVFR